VLALDVPSGIRDVLMHRVHRLPDDTQSLLTLAAVAGRELVPELLAYLAGLDAEHLLFNLEPAVAAGLVTPAEAGWGYRFRHPLIHESLYASTGPAGQARLHGRVATALEAAARAVRQGAWPDAVRHLHGALSVIAPGTPGAEATRCDVLTDLGQACRSGGLIAEAHRALADAVSLAHRIGDEDRELAAFGAPALWGSREWGEPDTGLVPLLERQLSRIADTDPSRRIRILSTLATELAHDQGHDRGWGYAADALEAARGLGRPEELSLAVNAYLVFAHMTDRVAEGRQLMDEMLAAGDQVSVPVQALIQANLLTERIRFAELARFDAEFPAAWRLAADEPVRLRELPDAHHRHAQRSRRGAGRPYRPAGTPVRSASGRARRRPGPGLARRPASAPGRPARHRRHRPRLRRCRRQLAGRPGLAPRPARRGRRARPAAAPARTATMIAAPHSVR
jgi:hypothetical protein